MTQVRFPCNLLTDCGKILKFLFSPSGKNDRNVLSFAWATAELKFSRVHCVAAKPSLHEHKLKLNLSIVYRSL